MQPRKTIFGVLAGTVLLAGTTLLAQGPPPQGYYQGGPPPQGYQGPPPGYQGQQGQPWEVAPPEFQEIQRKGFHDGIEGARKDYGNHRRPDVNNRDEFRHPNVPRELRHDYREAFRRGYQVGVEHLMHGGY